MKNANYILAFSFLLFGCGQKNSDLIIGKWKIDDIVTAVNWSKVEPERKIQIEKDIFEHVAVQKAVGYYEFFPDGNANNFDGRGEYGFRWRMNKEETIIYFKPPQGITEDAFDIETLEKTKFVFTKTDKDGETRITLVK
jgi:hypothetical protein